MVQGSKKANSGAPPASEDAGHVLGILSSLFTNIASETPARLRLLTKFVENNYEKADKLLEIRDSAQNRLTVVDAEIEKERKELVVGGDEIGTEEEDTWYLRRLDGGLFTLQTVDYILAWICMEDDGVSGMTSNHKRHIITCFQVQFHLTQMLDRKSKSLKDIVRTLQVYHDNVEEGEGDEDGGAMQKEILRNLIAFLDSC